MESGERRELAKETASFKAAAQKSANSYVVALGANVALLDNDAASAKTLMDRLVDKQDPSGKVTGATTSVVGSSGLSLDVETTSLAALAWLRQPAYAGAVAKAMQFITQSCTNGMYGSTQSTVLALRTILAYDKTKTKTKPKSAGNIAVLVDGKRIGTPTPITEDAQGAIALADITNALTPGKHVVELKQQDGASIPFAATVDLFQEQPQSDEACKLRIETALKDVKVQEGGITEINLSLKNLSAEVVPMPLAIVGIPGGLEIRHDQLKELKKAGRIAAYEVMGRDLVLYWRELGASQELKLPLSVVAQIPGTYTGPASRAYLYYGNELKRWVPGLKVEIAPK